MPWRDDPSTVRPMLASTAGAPLDSAEFAYEPKYDGIRVIVAVHPSIPSEARPGSPEVRLWSRLGNEKTSQFPDVVKAIGEWGRAIERPLVVDGEIVALDARDEPAGFQNLQGRIHLRNPGLSGARADASVAFIAFDLLREGDEDLRGRPLRERRARLEQLFAHAHHPRVRLSEQAVGDGRALHARASEHGWEGLVAKRLDSLYKSARRTPDWRKVKLAHRQTCVVGGWTDPRGSRPFFGALLLGVYDDHGALQYVGHSGAGFSDAELGRVWKRLHALQTQVCPFAATPRTNEKPHWVQPTLVAEVKFTEWTADGKLRHPTYLGLRDDVDPSTVRKEPDIGGVRIVERAEAAERAPLQERSRGLTKAAVKDLIAQLDAIEAEGGDGVLQLPAGSDTDGRKGDRLDVTNLGKVFWPRAKLTKGDLMRHDARVAPYLLPVLADRPLVMKRYPNGVDGKPFYQHRAPDRVPRGVRIERVASASEVRPYFIGGSLKTLLYTAQLAAISQDPWFSRIGQADIVDYVAIDLDPPEGTPFRRVLDVARWVRDELDALKAPGFAKTSGAGGLHVYVPMPPDTSYEAVFCQIVATIVAKKHPKVATIERAVKARGGRVYVDYLQNVRGKTLASAYSARASEFAGVSTPLTWTEVEDGVSPRDFTIVNFSERMESVGDLWAALRKSKGADLRAVMKYAEP